MLCAKMSQKEHSKIDSYRWSSTICNPKVWVVPSSVYQSLVVAIVLSRPDYGNATLAGLPSPVCHQHGSLVNRRSSSLGAYHRCCRQFSLAPSTRAHQVQTGGHVYRALYGTAPQRICRTGCSTSLICRRDVEAVCARQPPVFSTSARHGVSLSAIALLLLLAHDSGIVYLPTTSLPHHSQHFVRNWKHIYYGNHTQTLFCSCVAIVVLEVRLT